jgi:ATP-binding cassette subfamily B (MDR/TAP) protein 1
VGAVLLIFIFSFCSRFLLQLSAYRIESRIKAACFDAIVRQEIGFFDNHKTGSFLHVFNETVKIRSAISADVLHEFCSNCAQFFVGIGLALLINWKMALIGCASIPFVFIMLFADYHLLVYLNSRISGQLADSAITAREVIRSIRTVRSMSGEKKEQSRYNRSMNKVRIYGWLLGSVKGISSCLISLAIYGSVAGGFWYVGYALGIGQINVVAMSQVFLLLMMSLFAVIVMFNTSPAFVTALGAVKTLGKIILQHPVPRNKKEKIIENVQGHIVFDNVSFRYPSRYDVQVLKNLNLEILPKQSIGLVGPSGSGKSSIISLIDKWYENYEGSITIDGVNLAEINSQWLHGQIGIVQQETLLFATTIRKNITYAVEAINCNIREAAKKYPNEISSKQLEQLLIPVTDTQIMRAAMAANAHEFISDLPDGYDTLVGEHGSLLSVCDKLAI